jgi:hypothetical protein
MRKWISGMKLTTSERIEKEEDRKFREEYAEAHPSEDALSGPLSDEHKDKVQAKVDARFDQECEEAFSNVIEKAKILVKLSIPEVLVERARIQRQRTIQKSLSFKLREKLMQGENKLKKKDTFTLINSEVAKKDAEYNWTQRLQNWKAV